MNVALQSYFSPILTLLIGRSRIALKIAHKSTQYVTGKLRAILIATNRHSETLNRLRGILIEIRNSHRVTRGSDRKIKKGSRYFFLSAIERM